MTPVTSSFYADQRKPGSDTGIWGTCKGKLALIMNFSCASRLIFSSFRATSVTHSNYLTSCTSCPFSHAASHVCSRVSPLAQAFFLGKSLSMLPPAFSDPAPATAPRDTGAGVAAGGVPHAPQDPTSILLIVVTTLSSSSSVPPGTMHSSRRCQGLSSNQDCFG